MSRGAPVGRAAAAILFAPGIAYNAAVRVRNALFDGGYLKTHKLPCSVISVGNLTVGGTGKTPITSFLAGLLSDSGRRVGVVSRGYRRRRSRHRSLLVSDGRALLADPAAAGDEPYLIARENPYVPVAVGSDRLNASRLLLQAFTPDVIVLDDGFQHRALGRDLDLLLVDGRDPWGNGRMLPFGPLREPLSAVSRADALILTRPAGGALEAVSRVAARYNPQAALFSCRIEPVGFRERTGGAMDRGALTGLGIFAFSGIARPDRFEDDVRSLGARIVGSRRFPDHHHFSQRDLDGLVRSALSCGAEYLVTTEKDLVRISGLPTGSPPLCALTLSVRFDTGSDLPGFVLDRLPPTDSRSSTRGTS